MLYICVKELTALSILTFVLLLTGLLHELTELLSSHIQRNEMFECCLVRIYLSLTGLNSVQVLSNRIRSGVIEQDLHLSINVMDQTKISSGPDRQARPVNHATSH